MSQPSALSAQDRVERDAKALLKQILTDYEQLADLAPAEAVRPIEYNARRKRIVRSLWNFVQVAMRAGGEIVTVYECPRCHGTRTVVTRDPNECDAVTTPYRE